MEQKADENHPDNISIDFYKEICSNIRVTDEISFKLLGIVPIISGIGSGALSMLGKSQSLTGYTNFAVFSLSVFGALITCGLFIWELKNIRKCAWLINRAADFEKHLLKKNHPLESIQFAGMEENKA